VTALGIGLLVLVHVLDYATVLAMVVQKGIGSELNPIVVRIAEDYGLALLTVGKAAAVLLVVSTFLVLGRSRPRLATSVLVVGILVGAMGTLSNVASI
jgi:hypothetical protein